MLTLFEDGMAKALEGHTSLEEVLRIAVPPEDFRLADRLSPDGKLLSTPMLGNRRRSSGTRRKKTVLVVEDSQAIRKMLSFILESDGFSVEQAADGEQAWKMLQALRPDVVICDYEMPKMTGAELIARARQDSRFDNIPFIMLTSRTNEEDEVSSLELGADDYITKPLEPMRILARVKRILSIYERIRNANRPQLKVI